MQFTSVYFLAFLPAAAAGFFIAPRRLKALFLLMASLGFYLFRNLRYGVFILASIAITYVFGLLLEKWPARKKPLLAAGILANMAFLLFFKYANFAILNLNLVTGASLPLLNLAVPVGISFYTFQSTGYLVDVYRGQTAAERNPVTYALFVAFFPQVQSGPIARSTTLLPQLRTPAPRFDAKRVERGLFMVGWGFFKKLVIADRLSIFVNAVFDEHGGGTGLVSLVAIVLYALEIYCDFSAYITIALGAAKIFGYELDKNFDLPYFSRSIPEFWRRWHITLGSWFRDYLFYPIQRSKAMRRLSKRLRKSRIPKGLARSLPAVIGLAVVWFCTGFWHGAGWNYIVWGLYHGGLIILGMLLGPWLERLTARLHIPVQSRWWKLVQTLRTFALVCVGYVFFRSPSLGAAGAFFRGLFQRGAGASLLDYGLDKPEWIVLIVVLILLLGLELAQRRINLLDWVPAQRLPLRWAVYLLGLLAIVVFGLYGEGYAEKPFVYFQF